MTPRALALWDAAWLVGSVVLGVVAVAAAVLFATDAVERWIGGDDES